MAPPNKAHLRSLYRALLRELPPRPILAPTRSRSPHHQNLRVSFASFPLSSSAFPAAKSTGASIADAGVPVAEQLVAYLRAQRSYAGLLDRYNPGMGVDQKERVRLTARRVGMNLPVEFKPPETN